MFNRKWLWPKIISVCAYTGTRGPLQKRRQGGHCLVMLSLRTPCESQVHGRSWQSPLQKAQVWPFSGFLFLIFIGHCASLINLPWGSGSCWGEIGCAVQVLIIPVWCQLVRGQSRPPNNCPWWVLWSTFQTAEPMLSCLLNRNRNSFSHEKKS